jgi:16S rRNA (uracil1498-N3)-methyltransferase
MLFYLPDLQQNLLPETEARHALQVLRLRKGDLISVTDGKGNRAQARILSEKTSACLLEISGNEHITPYRQEEIHLAVAPTKNSERMDWLIEKATEIGCNGFHFFKSDRTGRSHMNLERLQRIALSAIKQSEQYYLPEIKWYEKVQLLPFSNFDRIITADLSSKNTRLTPKTFRKMLFLIGPEGDFSPEELDWLTGQSTESVRFLPQVLRTETAALYALSLGVLSLHG